VLRKAGQVNETVEVSGETLPLVETTKDVWGGVLTQQEVKDLPIKRRDCTKLIFLKPQAWRDLPIRSRIRRDRLASSQ
jgi:hypothetical protein